MTQAWNPSQINANITLSNGNLTATDTGTDAVYSPGAASEGFATGKFYWEVVVAGGGFVVEAGAVGIANTSSAETTGDFLGRRADAIGYYEDGVIYNNNAVLTTLQTFTTGARICIALDLTNNFIWFRVGTGGNWNNNATNNPATPTGGIGITQTGMTITAHPVVPAFNLYKSVAGANPVDSVVAAFASASWAGTAPAGFGPFDVAAVTPSNPWAQMAPILAQ